MEMPIHGACKLSLPCRTRSPSDGYSCDNPSPRKSSAVSATTASDKMNGMKVTAETRALGRICRYMIRRLPTPSTLAALTNSKFLVRMNSARTIPVSEVQEKKSRIASSVQKDGRKILETIIRIKSCGKDSQISINRCIKISSRPPK